MAKQKKILKFTKEAKRPAGAGFNKFIHHSRIGAPVNPDSGDNKVVSEPRQDVKWDEAAAWVVKAHAGAWKRLED